MSASSQTPQVPATGQPTAPATAALFTPNPDRVPVPGPGDRGGVIATVVLPCYNEQDHVLQELERITSSLDASGLSYEILAIDDASTDGTLAVLRSAAERMPNVQVL